MDKLPFSARPLVAWCALCMARFCSNLLSCSVDPFRRPAFRVALLDLTRQQRERDTRYQSDAARRAPGGKRARLSHVEPLANRHDRRVSVHCSVHLELALFPHNHPRGSLFSPDTCSSTVWSFARRRLEAFRSLAVHKRKLCAFQTLGTRLVCAVAKGWARRERFPTPLPLAQALPETQRFSMRRLRYTQTAHKLFCAFRR